MLGRFVLLILTLGLLAPAVLVSEGGDGGNNSDTQRSIKVVIRHCTS